MNRVHIGCGMSTIPGWINCDNSFSVKIAKIPLLFFLTNRLGVLRDQMEFIKFCRHNHVLWVNATKKLPFADDSVDVIYSSHMVEHLEHSQIRSFLKEAYRVLAPNSIIRISIPDLRKDIDQYLSDNDANAFIKGLLLSPAKSSTITDRIRFLVVGNRMHKWMYDGESMKQLITSMGFTNTQIMKPGTTMINEPGELDLEHRETDSVYIEAVRP